MVRIAVVDDEERFREMMEEYLQRYARQKGKDLFVTCFENAFDFLEACGQGFDLVFLDIEMPMLDGMEAAHKFRQKDDNALLVFITNLASYAIRGYEVQAFDYILKPLPYQTFAVKLERCFRAIRTEGTSIVVKSREGGMRVFSPRDIYYLEIFNVDIIYHTVCGDYTARGHLKEVEMQLTSFGFSRCNNSCLVNLHYVAGVDKQQLMLTNGHTLQISRPRKKEFLDNLTRYIGRNK